MFLFRISTGLGRVTLALALVVSIGAHGSIADHVDLPAPVVQILNGLNVRTVEHLGQLTDAELKDVLRDHPDHLERVVRALRHSHHQSPSFPTLPLAGRLALAEAGITSMPQLETHDWLKFSRKTNNHLETLAELSRLVSTHQIELNSVLRLDKPLAEVGLTPRLVEILNIFGLQTLRDVSLRREEELFALPGFYRRYARTLLNLLESGFTTFDAKKRLPSPRNEASSPERAVAQILDALTEFERSASREDFFPQVAKLSLDEGDLNRLRRGLGLLSVCARVLTDETDGASSAGPN